MILVYDLLSPATKERIHSFWLPKIVHENNSIPVLIVGNKLDRVGEGPENRERDHKMFIDQLVDEFPQVEMGIECSAKLHEDLTDLLYCAERAVLYPIFPLYDHTTKQLKVKYVSCLKRIFRICDTDQDGYLDNEELGEFQKKIFTIDLSPGDINAVKEVLVEEVFCFFLLFDLKAENHKKKCVVRGV